MLPYQKSCDSLEVKWVTKLGNVDNKKQQRSVFSVDGGKEMALK